MERECIFMVYVESPLKKPVFIHCQFYWMLRFFLTINSKGTYVKKKLQESEQLVGLHATARECERTRELERSERDSERW